MCSSAPRLATHTQVGNSLFKQGKYEWAIRTYVDGVHALASKCYASRERMLWDYFARGIPHINHALVLILHRHHQHAPTFNLALTTTLALSPSLTITSSPAALSTPLPALSSPSPNHRLHHPLEVEGMHT